MKLIHFISIIFIFSIMFLENFSHDLKKPTVLIIILVRNKAHTLPYFLTFLERLTYPKKRIHLW